MTIIPVPLFSTHSANFADSSGTYVQNPAQAAVLTETSAPPTTVPQRVTLTVSGVIISCLIGMALCLLLIWLLNKNNH